MTAEGIVSRLCRLERARQARERSRSDERPAPAESPEDTACFWVEVLDVLNRVGVMPFPDDPEPQSI